MWRYSFKTNSPIYILSVKWNENMSRESLKTPDLLKIKHWWAEHMPQIKCSQSGNPGHTTNTYLNLLLSSCWYQMLRLHEAAVGQLTAIRTCYRQSERQLGAANPSWALFLQQLTRWLAHVTVSLSPHSPRVLIETPGNRFWQILQH